MEAVGLHEIPVLGDTGEQVRDQGDMLAFGDLLKHGLKAGRVSRTVVGWQWKRGQYDLASECSAKPNQLGEVVADEVEAETAQTIVGAKLDDEYGG